MSRHAGQAMVESLALAAVLALALLLPFGNSPPIATVLLETLVGFLRTQAFVLSIV